MALDKRLSRHYIVIAIIVIASVITIFRYAKLALSPYELKTKSNAEVLVRGSILDRNGRLLAVDTDLYDVSLWKPSIRRNNESSYAEILADCLSLDKDELLYEIEDASSPFMYLARRISQAQVELLENAIEKNRLSGIKIDRLAGRVYPEGSLASHLIGYVGTENHGLAGAEVSFDKMLSAKPEEPTNHYAYGNNVFLTIDSNLQSHLEHSCRKVIEENNAQSLAMVVVDAKTGDVLSYVSLPDFEPSKFLEADKESKIDRVSIYAYEPGSVFKVFSMSSLISLGAIDEKSTFTCNGKYERHTSSGEEIIINCLGHHGTINVSDILKYSCNAGAAYASDLVSNIDFYAKLREFGFGEKVGADVSGESYGLIRDPKEWSGRTKPTVAIGQEVLVTAMQLVEAATAIANKGSLIRLHTLEKIEDIHGNIIEKPEPAVLKKVMEEYEAQMILNAMESASLDTGTGRRARIDDIRMSVKTGTAQMIDPKTRRYSDTDYIASTIAIFPSENPEYIVYAAVFKPMGDSIFGSKIAAPLVKEVAEYIAGLYSVERKDVDVYEHSGRVVLQKINEVSVGKLMPDLYGQSKRALLPLLQKKELSVELLGEGWVYEQSPLPGTALKNGDTIYLRLK